MAEVQKKELNQAAAKKFWTSDMEAIIAITLVLLILGTINVFSSSFIFAEAEFDTPYFFLKRHVLNIFIGLIAFGVCLRFDYHVWRRAIVFIVIGTFLALVAVLFFGPVVNGAQRWLPLPFGQFQPAELAKLVSIMIAAAYISYKIKLEQE
ncbi:MAG: FtsW/RodA/SpoVE family cell cycle protein, partial [Selenomonadaceae bacterium]|nr:FtsW/RodA/SpoVE family cell cycle protein [Selenomonadaceae bacterium]